MKEHPKPGRIGQPLRIASTPRARLLVALIAFMLLIPVWWQASHWQQQRLLDDQRSQVAARTLPLNHAITLAISRRINLLEGLRTFVEVDASPQHIGQHFESLAAGLYSNSSVIRNLSLAPAGVQQYVYPQISNEIVLGHDLLNDDRPNVRADVRRAIETGQITLSNPYELRQGGLGIVARQAIYGEDGSFWGFAVIVLDVEDVLTEAGIQLQQTDLAVALRDGTNQTFFGQDAVFEADPVVSTLDLPEGEWKLAALPQEGWQASIQDSLWGFHLTGLLVVALLVGIILWIGSRQAHLVRAVQERTRTLAQELAQREQTERALRDSEALWRSLVTASPEHVLTLDTDLIIQFANRASPGLTVEKLVGTPLYAYVAEERRAEIRKILETVLRTGEPATYETEYPSPDGILYYESRVVPRNVAGKTVGLTVSARDLTNRKRAEMALSESEERFKRALAHIPDVIVMYSPDLRIRYVNVATHALTGRPTSDYIGKRDDEIWPPEVYQTYLPTLQDAFDSREVRSLETDLALPEGRLLNLRITCVPILDETGNVREVMGITHNFTERKQAQEALRESNEFLDSIVENIPDMLFVKDAQDLCFVRLNKAEETLLGYPREEMIGKNDYDLFPKDEADFFTTKDREVLETGTVLDIPEEVVQTGQGGKRILHTKKIPLYDDQGTPQYLLGISEDITARKQAEEARREASERLNATLAALPDLLFEIDRHGRYIDVRAPRPELLYVSPEEILGKTISETLPQEAASIIMEALARAAETGHHTGATYALSMAQETHWFELSIAAKGDPAGPDCRFVVLARDITERKQAEQALKEYSERLEERVDERTRALRDAQEQLVRREKLAVLGQLAGGVGHDLRNPLGVISNAVYLLRMTLPDADETTRECLDMISGEVGSATKIVSNLLDFGRTGPANRQAVPISTLITQALKKCTIPDHVQVTTHLPDDLPDAWVDPHQIGEQVLVNLIANACQAMPLPASPSSGDDERETIPPLHPPHRGGQEGGDRKGGQITLHAKAGEGTVLLSVTDTGCGIPQENMGKLFEPLFTTKPRGIGLGLATCKNLVEANGGQIEVESMEGKGTTFTILLPTEEPVL
jgi:PAS domain S-box-containing protein